MKKILAFFVFFNVVLSFAQIRIFADFENSNVELKEISDSLNKVVFRPSLKTDDNTTRCWFYFGITGFDTSRILQLEYVGTLSKQMPETPVFSCDKKNWQRIKAKHSSQISKYVEIKTKCDTLFFAAGYPYTYSDLMNFVKEIAKNPLVDTQTLAFSEKGLKIPLLIINDKASEQTEMVWILARQHAFEVPSNYVLEGFVNYLVSDDRLAEKLRAKVIFFIVPMMDVDNVFAGASGRLQKPVDFNRDWTENPYWNAVKAVENMLKNTSEQYNYRVFMDFHSTYPGNSKTYWGAFNSYKKTKKQRKNLNRFLKIYNRLAGYEILEINGKFDKSYAETFNAGKNGFSIKAKDFSTTLEFEWNKNYNNAEFTQAELKKVGELFAKSLCKYLK